MATTEQLPKLLNVLINMNNYAFHAPYVVLFIYICKKNRTQILKYLRALTVS